MAELRDPDLPPGEIVEKREDGIWVRNDGVELSPAEKNPYYVLATVHGEHGKQFPKHASSTKHLNALNRRIWNGWACHDLSAADLEDLEKKIGLEPGNLKQLTDEERDLARAALRTRIGWDKTFPKPTYVDLFNTYFMHSVSWEKCIFPGEVDFPFAHFAGAANFGSAYIVGDADFSSTRFFRLAGFDHTHFTRYATFADATFERLAEFSKAQFSGSADFASSSFTRNAKFNAAHFAKVAEFTSARFRRDAEFSNAQFNGAAFFNTAHFNDSASFPFGKFDGQTDFRQAKFQGRVPRFEQRNFHDKTNFTQAAVGSDGTRHWPEVPQDKRLAQDDKDAYRRLRQISANQHNPEAEHFFLRQEMACDAILKEDWLSRFVVRAFGVFSSYGYSVWRPIAGLLATWGIGALLIQIVFAWAIVYGTPASGMTEVPGLMDAFGLGLANTFAIFGFRSYYLGEAYMIALPVLVKLIGGVQTVLGFIFLFFLGLGLRNRFRLK